MIHNSFSSNIITLRCRRFLALSTASPQAPPPKKTYPMPKFLAGGTWLYCMSSPSNPASEEPGNVGGSSEPSKLESSGTGNVNTSADSALLLNSSKSQSDSDSAVAFTSNLPSPDLPGKEGPAPTGAETKRKKLNKNLIQKKKTKFPEQVNPKGDGKAKKGEKAQKSQKEKPEANKSKTSSTSNLNHSISDSESGHSESNSICKSSLTVTGVTGLIFFAFHRIIDS